MPLRTRIYIDGFNLYYGCLRQTPYKWLDLIKLFEQHILPTALHRPDTDANASSMVLDECAIRYFTAPILGSAAKGPDSVASQSQYHAALLSSKRISLTKGYYSLTKSSQYLVDADNPDKHPNLCGKTQVWKLEEKQSDVNLALALYDDALHCPELDQLVLVTNDTDIAPALELIKKKRPELVIGLVIPTRLDIRKEDDAGYVSDKERQANADLRKLANWTRTYIRAEELAASQLPRVVTGGRKAAIKPLSWYPRPDLLEAAMIAAKPVRQRPNQFFSWAELPSPYLGNRRPIDLLEDEVGAAEVMAYIETYIREQLPADADLN